MSTTDRLAALKHELAVSDAAYVRARDAHDLVLEKWEAFIKDEAAVRDLLRAIVWRLSVEQSRGETVYVLKPVPNDPAAERLLQFIPAGHLFDVQMFEPVLRFNRGQDHHPRVALEFTDVGGVAAFLAKTPLVVRNRADNDMYYRLDRLRREVSDIQTVLELMAAAAKPG